MTRQPFLLHLVMCGLALSLANAQPNQPQVRRNQATATGVVYNDTNRNLRRDPDEPGIPRVSVSNGREVVQTDQQGRYRLPVNSETIIFVTKPSGYMVPVNEAQLPQFYYIHYPDGTPGELGLEYPSIAPTGPLPKFVNFPLYEQAEEDRFKVIAFADPQTGDDQELSYFRDDVVAELIGTEAAFGITVGDVLNDDLSLYPRHNALVSAVGVPWWNLPGNHDMNYEAPSDRYATETYKSVYGPTAYSFDYGQVHFVTLDNVEYYGAEEGGYRGKIPEEQLEWLRNDLRFVSADKLIVVAAHIPLETYAVDRDEGITTANVRKLLSILESRRYVYSIAGHDTSNSWQLYLGPNYGWMGAEPFHHQVLAEVRGNGWGGLKDERGIPETPMEDGNPNGYYILSFNGNQYSVRFKAASKPADYQMRLMLEQRGEARNQLSTEQWEVAAWQNPQFVVNVFDGSPRHEVRYRVDGGEFAQMKRVIRTDPYLEDLYVRHLGTEEEISTPNPSSHIWVAEAPDNLQPGVHIVTVRSTDPYGQVSEASQVFEVAEAEE